MIYKEDDDSNVNTSYDNLFTGKNDLENEDR